ncbi:ferric reductase like transmembrane component-domain-containing protein [Macrophomina phaseolina]|uniref:Ferric reductase like transmembrane component-domain-containing protein n=1 Tax=Macrophomina phaseolina TaxID=35725 RepID=A0ABQ8G7N9_9PEZI|nr:ferric reductase like transmembrane component-domain-containing protein [Macrophomina phaseolina]
MLGYEFVTLDNEQTANRRQLLDLYGSIGQWSVLVMLALVQLAFFIRWAIFKTAKVERPRSPHPNKVMDFGSRAWYWRLEEKLTRFRWWADERPREGWFTKGECILGLVWSMWLLFLCVHRTGNDYLHLTKRFGMVAASQLPLQYILAMRSAYSPLQALTRLSYERVIAIHELLGKILTIFFGLHAVFYFNFFIRAGVISKRIRDVDVITGVIAFIMFSTMSTTALSFLRNWNYRVFYTTHILLALILVDVLIFHVSHIRTYVFEMLAFFVLLQIFRQAKTRQFPGSIAIVPGTNLIQVTIPLTSEKLCKEFKPGQHIHLSKPPLVQASQSWANAFAMRYRTNPFTIASVPAKDKQILLIARPLAGNTKHLAAVAQSLRHDNSTPSIPLTIEGPYGAAFPDFNDFDHVLLVAGGVGATFALPLFRSLTEGTPDSPPVLRTRVHLVWAVRRLAETRWAFPHATAASKQEGSAAGDGDNQTPPLTPASPDNQHVDIFVTRGGDAAEDADADGRQGLLAEDEDIELAEGSGMLHDEDHEGEKPHDRSVSRGRPDLRAIVDDAFSNSTGAVAVLVCGPGAMVSGLRRHVGVWVTRGRDVFWHAEAFGL